MTKSTITRERLQEIAEDGFLKHGESKELARMALAAMDSEPVAYTDERNLGYIDRGRETAYLWGKQNSESSDVALYRHAQPAQTGVDDDVRSIIGLLEANEWAEHCTETVLGSRLEAEITRLVGCVQPAPVVPDELAKAFISAIEKEQDRLSDEDYLMDSRDCIDVIREELERLNPGMLAVASQEAK